MHEPELAHQIEPARCIFGLDMRVPLTARDLCFVSGYRSLTCRDTRATG